MDRPVRLSLLIASACSISRARTRSVAVERALWISSTRSWTGHDCVSYRAILLGKTGSLGPPCQPVYNGGGPWLRIMCTLTRGRSPAPTAYPAVQQCTRRRGGASLCWPSARAQAAISTTALPSVVLLGCIGILYHFRRSQTPCMRRPVISGTVD